MADGYDRFDNEGGGGGSFVMGLLTGTVLGAGLGMLFAPKSGPELRRDLSEQASNLANSASEVGRRAQESATEWAGRGREVYDRARDAVARGADEAQRYVRDATTGSQPSTAPSGSGPGGSSYGSESTRDSSSQQIRGGSSGGSSTGSTGSTGGPRRS